MTNICEICGCENPATRMYEKEGEVFRMICDFHEKQVKEKKIDPAFKC
jgi:hypothetical protein